MNISIETISKANHAEAIAYLSQHEDTAIFLLGNLNAHGPHLSSHPNSGNFKLIRVDHKIKGVFCLVRRGNLLIQSDLIHPVFTTVTESCHQEGTIRGLIAEWDFATSFWHHLKENQFIQKESYGSKEINYALSLDDWQEQESNGARKLETHDYPLWHRCRLNYLLEQNLPNDLSDQEMEGQFIEMVQSQSIWGLFNEGQLISMANLSARTDRAATVGGVYTVPEFRKKGFAKALMKKLIMDCKKVLSLHKLIIFTGELENKPAQRLYESLGCKKVGYMALFFGE